MTRPKGLVRRPRARLARPGALQPGGMTFMMISANGCVILYTEPSQYRVRIADAVALLERRVQGLVRRPGSRLPRARAIQPGDEDIR
jgi:hypothetical protein